MSLRSPHAVAVGTAGHEFRLNHVLAVGQRHQKAKTTQRNIDGITDQLSRLNAEGEDIDATGKRKVDGSLAATRLGQTTSERWANERFRQTMLLILEFRREWPTQLVSLDS